MSLPQANFLLEMVKVTKVQNLTIRMILHGVIRKILARGKKGERGVKSIPAEDVILGPMYSTYTPCLSQ